MTEAPMRMSFREALLFVILGVILAFAMDKERPAALSNDSFQYLSVAANVAHGKGIETSLIHFDSERSSGRIPAPMTTFGPGYPAVVALSSFVTGSAEQGGRLISIIASALCALLLWGLANFVRLGRSFTRAGMILLLANGSFLHFSTAVATEPLFLLVSLAGLLAIASSIGGLLGQTGSVSALLLGQVLVAASYSVRYAGIFVFVGVVVHATMSWALRRNRQSLLYLLSNVVSGALIATIMIRNMRFVGTWKGGNEKHVNNPMGGVLSDYVKAQYHLLFGNQAIDVWTICATGLSVIAISWGMIAVLRYRSGLLSMIPSGGSLLFTYACVATAGLIYLGKTSVISFGPRMFYPLLPLYIIGALVVIQKGWRTRAAKAPAPFWQVAGVLLVVLYAWVNLRDVRDPSGPSLADVVQASFAKPMSNGEPLRQWFDENVGKDEAVAADAGQATGYVLERPMLSLVSSQYSNLAWNQDTLITQMERFHARFLILNLTMTPIADPVRVESDFLAKAICCRIDPGFHVVAENPDVRIIELNDR